jgi:6-phospho-3-hexuloisomerase
MWSYRALAEKVLDEHRQVLLDVKPEEVEQLLDAIAKAKCIQVFGTGRMKCSVRAFVMRLMHMGLDAHVVYDTTCPAIGPADLLIVNGACTGVSYMVMGFAKKLGATVCAITAHPESKWGELCDFTIRLRGQVNPGQLKEIAQSLTMGVGAARYAVRCGQIEEIPSVQPMAALFEQTIFVFEDVVIQLLMQKLNISAGQMAKRRTNLDGYSA